MISAQEIACPNIERKCYIMYCNFNTGESKCIGSLVEQENDAGEVQYVYNIWQDKITDDDLHDIILSGIDLNLRQTRYVRSGGLPIFIDKCTPKRARYDYKRLIHRQHLDYYDPFEFMMRCRNMTHHSNCYVGRTPTDFCDFKRAMKDSDYYSSLMPNLKETPENVFHPIR